MIDPPAPPEAGETSSLRAKDLKGQVCIFHPVGEGEWPAKEDRLPQPYIECDVWTLDRAGIVANATGVRVSWWRAVAQLRSLMGEYVASRVVEQDDRSVILVPLEGQAREVAEVALKEVATDNEPVYDAGQEPF